MARIYKKRFLKEQEEPSVLYYGCSMCYSDEPYYGGLQQCSPLIPFTFNSSDIQGNEGVIDPYTLDNEEYIPGFASINYAHGYMFQTEELALTTPTIGCLGGPGYDPNAGCTDSNASNYDPLATTDDGSCEYEPEPCPELMVTYQPSYITENPTTIEWTGGCPDLPMYITFNAEGYAAQINVNWEAGSDFIPNTGTHTWNIPCDLVEAGVEYYYYIAQMAEEGIPYSGGSSIYNMNGVAQGGSGFYLYSNYNYGDGGVYGTIIVTEEACPSPPIYGCTDLEASNYNSEAEVDDGSCVYPIEGCTDPQAFNPDPEAEVDDGSCIYACEDLEGASSPLDMMNLCYGMGLCDDWWNNSDAPPPGTTDYPSENWGNQDMGPGDYFLNPYNQICGCCPVLGCTDPEALNYNSFAADAANNNYSYQPDAGLWAQFFPDMVIECIYPVLGCTDSGADNYNPEADTDDGSCLYEGCMDGEAINFDDTANVPCEDLDGNGWPDCCEYEGCMDPAADNYNPNAVINDGSCEYSIEGCTDSEASNYNSSATIDDGSCVYPVYGCTDPTAYNFDSEADTDDGSCDYLGCMDMAAVNFNDIATIDDGSCQYEGCMDETAANYDETATIDDGSCQYAGCTDNTALNYNFEADIDDGSCEYTIFTCESIVSNQMEILGSECVESISSEPADGETTFATLEACEDSGCGDTFIGPELEDEEGCTDPPAVNFNPNAIIDDGSCLYEVSCFDCIEGVWITLEVPYNEVTNACSESPLVELPEDCPDPCEDYNALEGQITNNTDAQVQACYMALEAPLFDVSTGSGFSQEVIDFFLNLTNNGECCPEEEIEIRYSCITPLLPEQYVIDQNVQPTCVEDPNGPFTSMDECEEYCPEEDCSPLFNDDIDWVSTGFLDIENFCGRCTVDPTSAEGQMASVGYGSVTCDCCDQVNLTDYATGMALGCEGFNSELFPQDFRDLICEQCEDPNYVNVHCECCEEGVNWFPEEINPPQVIPPSPQNDIEINRMKKLANIKKK